MCDLNKCCYLCLNEDNNLVNVYGVVGSDYSAGIKLKFVLPELIYFTNDIDVSLCQKCIEDISSFYTFKTNCLNKNAELLIRINEIKKRREHIGNVQNEPGSKKRKNSNNILVNNENIECTAKKRKISPLTKDSNKIKTKLARVKINKIKNEPADIEITNIKIEKDYGTFIDDNSNNLIELNEQKVIRSQTVLSQNVQSQNIPTQNIDIKIEECTPQNVSINKSHQSVVSQNFPSQNIQIEKEECSSQNVQFENEALQNIPTQSNLSQNVLSENTSSQNIEIKTEKCTQIVPAENESLQNNTSQNVHSHTISQFNHSQNIKIKTEDGISQNVPVKKETFQNITSQNVHTQITFPQNVLSQNIPSQNVQIKIEDNISQNIPDTKETPQNITCQNTFSQIVLSQNVLSQNVQIKIEDDISQNDPIKNESLQNVNSQNIHSETVVSQNDLSQNIPAQNVQIKIEDDISQNDPIKNVNSQNIHSETVVSQYNLSQNVPSQNVQIKIDDDISENVPMENESLQNVNSQNIHSETVVSQNDLPQNIPFQNVQIKIKDDIFQNTPTRNESLQNAHSENTRSEIVPSQNVLSENIPCQNVQIKIEDDISQNESLQNVHSETVLSQNDLSQNIPSQENLYENIKIKSENEIKTEDTDSQNSIPNYCIQSEINVDNTCNLDCNVDCKLYYQNILNAKTENISSESSDIETPIISVSTHKTNSLICSTLKHVSPIISQNVINIESIDPNDPSRKEDIDQQNQCSAKDNLSNKSLKLFNIPSQLIIEDTKHVEPIISQNVTTIESINSSNDQSTKEDLNQQNQSFLEDNLSIKSLKMLNIPSSLEIKLGKPIINQNIDKNDDSIIISIDQSTNEDLTQQNQSSKILEKEITEKSTIPQNVNKFVDPHLSKNQSTNIKTYQEFVSDLHKKNIISSSAKSNQNNDCKEPYHLTKFEEFETNFHRLENQIDHSSFRKEDPVIIIVDDDDDDQLSSNQNLSQNSTTTCDQQLHSTMRNNCDQQKVDSNNKKKILHTLLLSSNCNFDSLNKIKENETKKLINQDHNIVQENNSTNDQQLPSTLQKVCNQHNVNSEPLNLSLNSSTSNPANDKSIEPSTLNSKPNPNTVVNVNLFQKLLLTSKNHFDLLNKQQANETKKLINQRITEFFTKNANNNQNNNNKQPDKPTADDFETPTRQLRNLKNKSTPSISNTIPISSDDNDSSSEKSSDDDDDYVPSDEETYSSSEDEEMEEKKEETVANIPQNNSGATNITSNTISCKEISVSTNNSVTTKNQSLLIRTYHKIWAKNNLQLTPSLITYERKAKTNNEKIPMEDGRDSSKDSSVVCVLSDEESGSSLSNIKEKNNSQFTTVIQHTSKQNKSVNSVSATNNEKTIEDGQGSSKNSSDIIVLSDEESSSVNNVKEKLNTVIQHRNEENKTVNSVSTINNEKTIEDRQGSSKNSSDIMVLSDEESSSVNNVKEKSNTVIHHRNEENKTVNSVSTINNEKSPIEDGQGTSKNSSDIMVLSDEESSSVNNVKEKLNTVIQHRNEENKTVNSVSTINNEKTIEDGQGTSKNSSDIMVLSDEESSSVNNVKEKTVIQHGNKENKTINTVSAKSKNKINKVTSGNVKNVMHSYKCGVCRKLFNSYTSLSDHLQMHIADQTTYVIKQLSSPNDDIPKIYTCPICKETFDFALVLRSHLQRHAYFSRGSNPKTPKVYNSYHISIVKNKLRIPFTSDDGIKDIITTVHCHVDDTEKTISAYQTIMKKLYNHIKNPNIDRDYMNLVKLILCLYNIDIIDEIMELSKTDKNDETKCAVSKCDFSAPRRFMNFHMLEHTKNRCPKCFKATKKAEELQRHIKHKHQNYRGFQCKKCGRKYRFEMYLKLHEQTHVEDCPYHCDICNRKFIFNANYLQHMVTHDESKRVHECEYCGKKFFGKIALFAHTKSHTTVPKTNFDCDICGKKFTRTSNLYQHKFIHIGKKKFECATCGKRFLWKTHLKQHVVTHMDVKAYQCYICQKGFRDGTSLKRHIHTHSKGKKNKQKRKKRKEAETSNNESQNSSGEEKENNTQSKKKKIQQKRKKRRKAETSNNESQNSSGEEDESYEDDNKHSKKKNKQKRKKPKEAETSNNESQNSGEDNSENKSNEADDNNKHTKKKKNKQQTNKRKAETSNSSGQDEENDEVSSEEDIPLSSLLSNPSKESSKKETNNTKTEEEENKVSNDISDNSTTEIKEKSTDDENIKIPESSSKNENKNDKQIETDEIQSTENSSPQNDKKEIKRIEELILHPINKLEIDAKPVEDSLETPKVKSPSNSSPEKEETYIKEIEDIDNSFKSELILLPITEKLEKDKKTTEENSEIEKS